MIKNKLNWQAYSSEDRNSCIEAIKDTISRNDGYILNFNIFSDLALFLTIEIEEGRIFDLCEDLKKYITISKQQEEKLSANSKNDWWILLNISFSKGKGDLKIATPDVPG